MADNARPILVVGSVALDAVHTPTESASEVLGGAASYFCLSASLFAPVRLVAVVGEDFPAEHRRLLESRPVDLTGLQVRPGKTFRWTGRYSGVRLEDRETLDSRLIRWRRCATQPEPATPSPVPCSAPWREPDMAGTMCFGAACSMARCSARWRWRISACAGSSTLTCATSKCG